MMSEQPKEPSRKIGYRHSPYTKLIYRFVVGDERNPEQEAPKPIAEFDPDTGKLMYLHEDYRRYHGPVMRCLKNQWKWEATEVDHWKGEGIMPTKEEPEPIAIPEAIKIPDPVSESVVELQPEPKKEEPSREGMPEMPSSHARSELLLWVEKWWPGIPKPPKMDPMAGDKTPEFVNWISLYFPAEFRVRYRVDGDGEIEEQVWYKDSDGIRRSKKVKKKALIAGRKTNLTEVTNEYIA